MVEPSNKHIPQPKPTVSQEEAMAQKPFLIIQMFACLLFFSSCSGITPYHKDSTVERSWGRSIETAKYNQMANPDADKNPEPVLDLDGTAAAHNVVKYQESFKKTESKEIVNILKLQ
jgi:hypothetical protein